MKKSKLKLSFKVALASTIAATTAAAIVYTNSDIIKTFADSNESKFILDVENVDQDTLKISIDNIEDIPKSLQFSIQLDGVVPKKDESGKIVIEDLINKEKSASIITDYSYDEDKNTIDVLITSNDEIEKSANKVDVFKLDIEKASNNKGKSYTVTATENSEYKYVSSTNKEYTAGVEVANKTLSMNTAPTLNKKANVEYIELFVKGKISLTQEELSKYVEFSDADQDDVSLEVKDLDGKVITEFTSNTVGIYDLYVVAKDNFGGESAPVNIKIKVNNIEEDPVITRNDKKLENITINAGEVFNLMDGIKAVDALGDEISVTVKSDKELNLDPESTTKYTITYTAKDDFGRIAEESIILTVIANKAPVITGVKDHTLTVGDSFNPNAGVEVSDEDENIELVVESNVNTSIAGVYKVIYSATDSGKKTTRVQSTVIVNPKSSIINKVPTIIAEDGVIQLGETFEPLKWASATDPEDGDIDVKVVSGEVNTEVAGEYSITYSATDEDGATAIKTIKVIVNDPPQINAVDKTIKLGEKFEPLDGVTATDKEDGTITNIEVTKNDVKEDQEGVYDVTYSVEDKLGGKATKTIKVTVKRDVVLAESITINNKFDSLYVGASKVLTATIDENADMKEIEWSTSDESIASIEVIGNNVIVEALKAGEVTITAKTKDGSNKSDSVTIEVAEYKDKVEDFISGVIDTGIVTPVSGLGTVESPLEIEVQNVTVEKFNEFLKKIEKLNARLIEKVEESESTTYKIKVENKSLVSKFMNLFKGEALEEGFINITIANNLDNVTSLKSELEKALDQVNNNAPVIKGVKEEVVLTVGDKFDPREGVTVEDEDTNIELKIESNVDTNVPGVYEVIYSATDSGNKTTTVKSIVIVNPKLETINKVPVITANDVVIQLGEEFVALNGVTATDAEDGEITKIDVIRNEVNKDVAGKYSVTYAATDKNGATGTKTITVIVNDPPQINAVDKTIKLGEEFDPLSGVSAVDKEDGIITKVEVINTNVDTNNEGVYEVTYGAEDSLGGKTTKTIKVTVKRDTILAESITINDKFDSLYVGSSKVLTATIDEKADLKDIEWSTSDESIASIEVIGNAVKVIANNEGQVTITAKTKDGSNKSDSVTIDIVKYEDKVEEFITNVIDTDIVTPVVGTGTMESPLEMEVQNVTVEKFGEFLTKIESLNAKILEKIEEEYFTIYKIKVENNSLVSKFVKLFKNSTSDEGYIYVKIANNLDNADLLINNLEQSIPVESPEEGGDNNQGEETPGEETPGEETPGEETPGEETPGEETPGEETSSEETPSVDVNPSDDANNEISKDDEVKLPVTGQESVIGYIGVAITAIGAALSKKNKNKKQK